MFDRWDWYRWWRTNQLRRILSNDDFYKIIVKKEKNSGQWNLKIKKIKLLYSDHIFERFRATMSASFGTFHQIIKTFKAIKIFRLRNNEHLLVTSRPNSPLRPKSLKALFKIKKILYERSSYNLFSSNLGVHVLIMIIANDIVLWNLIVLF